MKLIRTDFLRRTPRQELPSEHIQCLRYGMLNGHFRWDLTKAWITMSNDSFFRLYGFSWVPPMWLQDEARKYL